VSIISRRLTTPACRCISCLPSLNCSGTYSDTLREGNAVCSDCPAGTTTINHGADSMADCGVCKPGFGGPGCANQCGGVGPAASYGPAGRAVGADCIPCSAAKTGYSFEWMKQNDLFAPRPVAKLGASSSADCLTEFVQVGVLGQFGATFSEQLSQSRYSWQPGGELLYGKRLPPLHAADS